MKMRKKTTINYLSNNELLYELNESKKSFCYFIDDRYGDFTVIIKNEDEITDELIEEAKEIKATQLNENIQRKLIKKKLSKKEIYDTLEKEQIRPENLTKEDIVFRIMDYSHIPEEVQEVKKTLLNRIKFPPFKHYAYINDKFTEVGRSHWTGGLDNGHFDVEQGEVTRQLALSIMLIVKRYSSKPNFCNYTYLEDMKSQALLQLSVVAIQFDESKSRNVFAWWSSTIGNSFLKVLKNEKKHRTIRDELMQSEVGMSSFSHQMDHEDN